MSDWYGASELADAYGTTGRTLAAWGRAYTDSGRSLQPILQRAAPDEGPGQSRYVYRTDPDPRWPGEEVQELHERSGKVWRQLVKRVSCKMTALHDLSRTGGWASKKLQRELDEVADEIRKVVMSDPWWQDDTDYGWLLDDPQPLDEPIPARGMPGIWNVEKQIKAGGDQ